MQSTSPHSTSTRSILILSTHLRLGLPSGFFHLAFPPIIYTYSSSPPFVLHGRPSHPPRLHYSNYTWRRVQITKLLVMQFSPFSRHLIPLQIPSSAPCSQTPSVDISLLVSETTFHTHTEPQAKLSSSISKLLIYNNYFTEFNRRDVTNSMSYCFTILRGVNSTNHMKQIKTHSLQNSERFDVSAGVT
jgi:hypothetical protein